MFFFWGFRVPKCRSCEQGVGLLKPFIGGCTCALRQTPTMLWQILTGCKTSLSPRRHNQDYDSWWWPEKKREPPLLVHVPKCTIWERGKCPVHMLARVAAAGSQTCLSNRDCNNNTEVRSHPVVVIFPHRNWSGLEWQRVKTLSEAAEQSSNGLPTKRKDAIRTNVTMEK